MQMAGICGRFACNSIHVLTLLRPGCHRRPESRGPFDPRPGFPRPHRPAKLHPLIGARVRSVSRNYARQLLAVTRISVSQIGLNEKKAGTYRTNLILINLRVYTFRKSLDNALAYFTYLFLFISYRRFLYICFDVFRISLCYYRYFSLSFEGFN